MNLPGTLFFYTLVDARENAFSLRAS